MHARKKAVSIREVVQSSFQEFFSRSSSAGITILVFTAIAMFWINSPFHESYTGLVHDAVKVQFGAKTISFTFEQFVNDGLMVLFFLVVGLEIKRELLVGELSSLRKALLPLIGAVLGMLFPALIYVAFNAGTDAVHGWGVPVATDIAFALGILALLGKRIPIGLKVFLAALAIVDDLLAVLVIAIFYTGTLNLLWLLITLLITAVLYLGNRLGVQTAKYYAFFGVLLWIAVLGSGVHATIAGVLLAMTIPARARLDASAFLRRAKDLLERIVLKAHEEDEAEPVAQADAIHALERSCEHSQSPLHRIEHGLSRIVSFGIMPVFALANAGVALDMSVISKLTSPISLGVILGLFIGKQLGVSLAVWLSVKFNIAELPQNVNFTQIYGVALLCGVGFTMALFVSSLAFASPTYHSISKLAILAGSVLSAIAGTVVLRIASSRKATAAL
ncbi:MAG: Na+/H+ antiporter NhaA [Ignavibacteria bacterium]|nr:Na+/H+ antiporter NhaA [Ignavibacteria bacterium]